MLQIHYSIYGCLLSLQKHSVTLSRSAAPRRLNCSISFHLFNYTAYLYITTYKLSNDDLTGITLELVLRCDFHSFTVSF